MSFTDGPAGEDLPPPAGPPANVPWGPPTLGAPPSAPAWGQPAAVWGRPATGGHSAVPAPVASTGPVYSTYGADPRSVSYAGFWKRAVGLIIDSLVLSLISIPINLVFQVVGLFLVGATRSPALLVLLMLATFGVSFYVWWRMIPGRIGACGATVGMSAMRIRLVPAAGRGAVSSGLAFVRALTAWLLQLVFFLPAVLYGVSRVSGADLDVDDSFRNVIVPDAFVASVFAFLLLLLYLPSLWQLVDRRYQTLYDKLCGVVVVND